MSEDKRSPAGPRENEADPADTSGGDVLRRAAQQIRAAPALQAFVPLSADEREAIADRAIQRVLGDPPQRASDPRPAPPRRSRRLGPRAAVVLGTTLAAAAAIVLVVRGGEQRAALAPFTMVVAGEQAARGAAETGGGTGNEPVRLRPETRVVITLSAAHIAAQDARDALVRLVLVRAGHATLLDPPVARRAGRLVIESPAGELLGPQTDGAAELVVVLGRELPGDDEVRTLAAGSGRASSLQVLRQAIGLDGFSRTGVDVLLGGCSAVLAAGPGAGPPTCEVAAGAPLRVWVGVPATAAVALELDGAPIAARRESRAGGAAFVLDAPAGPAALSVRTGDRALAGWQLAPAVRAEAVRLADAALAAHDPDRALAALDALPAGAPPETRLEVLRRRATIAYARGEVEREREARERAVALAHALGRISVEIDQSVAILYGLRNRHAVAEALPLARALERFGTLYTEGAVHRAIAHGLLASELGDLGAALDSFRRALALADRIGDAADAATVVAPLADVLQSLGRTGEARALIDAEVERGDRDTSPCARVEALTSAGWLLRDLDPGRARQLVDRSVELAAASCDRRLAISLVNQGWLLAAARQFDAARAALDRIAQLPRERDARVTVWALRLEAEIVLGQAPATAARYAQQLAARAATLCSTELAYEADLLRARALVRLDQPAQAARAFAAADRALTLWSRLVPLGEGRATFFERHDQLALEAIPFFISQVRRGMPGAGAALAATTRRSIARFSASLAGAGGVRARAERGAPARDHASAFSQTIERWPVRWTAAEHAGPVAGVCEVRDSEARVESEPGPGEREATSRAALMVHPLPHGLLLVASRDSAVEFREIPGALDRERDDELATRIARAAAPLLAGAPRVHLHVHRTLAALPLDRSLAALLGVPIAFAVDAPPRDRGPRCPSERRALLVANPQQNLWAASASARAVQRDLARMGFQVDTLEGPEATRAAVEAHLTDPCTALLQYDGHGIAPAELADDRAGDALVLAGGDLLTASDVLGLPRVPQAVVLNGCTTAAPGGLGLAQAFVLAGADQVVASLGAIAADDAARLATELFAAAPRGPADLDLVSVFARANPAVAPAGLRVYER
jgi:tetratricopeptide (TPR) repeat protein